jgi:predicted permease
MGNVVTGTISFLVGIFIVDVKEFYRRVWKKTFLFVTFKLFIFPFFIIPFLYLFNIHDEAAVSAIILAAMPLAFPSFSIAKQYEADAELMCSCVCLGTVLMLPVIVGRSAVAPLMGI